MAAYIIIYAYKSLPCSYQGTTLYHHSDTRSVGVGHMLLINANIGFK